MLSRLSGILPALGAGFLLLAVSACGSKAATPTPTPTPKVPLLKPQPGHVVYHPTEAQAFMYLPRSTVLESNGDILIADGGNWDRSGAKIVELSPSGAPLWMYTGGLVFPHAAYPDGNDILISDTGNDRIIEITRSGKTIWDSDYLGGGKGYLGQGKLSDGAKLLYPNDAFPMPGGEMLVSSRFTNSVYEINKAGQVKWSCSKFMFRQHNPRLLPNGKLMVADSDNGRVLIINHACTKILFQYGGLIWPRSFQQYTNGNFVIGDSLADKILEIDRKKRVLRTWSGIPAPFYITVLKNGDLLTQDTNVNGAVELSPSDSLVQKFGTTDPHKYPTSIVNPGFETTGPRGWLQGDLLTETLPAGQRADMYFDSSTAHLGKSSGRITWGTNTGHLSLFWFQTISVTPGHTYNFSGWIKAHNIQACNGCDYGPGTSPGSTAEFQGTYIDPNTVTSPSPSAVALGNSVTGTQGWTQETSSFTVPRGVTEMQISCRSDGRGTAWFDDVTVK